MKCVCCIQSSMPDHTVGCLCPTAEVVEVLGQLLEEAGMAGVFAIPRARIPVVKFSVPATGAPFNTVVVRNGSSARQSGVPASKHVGSHP